MKYIFNEDTGEMELGRDGHPETREVNGVMLALPLCQTEKGCPKGTPENQKTLSPENELCYEHDKECRAVGQFPDDAVVRRNAAIIREVEEAFSRYEKTKSQNELVQLMVLK